MKYFEDALPKTDNTREEERKEEKKVKYFSSERYLFPYKIDIINGSIANFLEGRGNAEELDLSGHK